MAKFSTQGYMHQADMLAQMPRPKAPAHYHFTEDEVKEWDNIVAALPPNWFAPENHGVLAAHVTAVVMVRELADMIKECKKNKDWINARHLTVEHRALIKDVRSFAVKLKIMSRSNDSTKRHELRTRKEMESRLPTIQHANPWSKSELWQDQSQTTNTQSASPWDSHGAAKEASG
jgi:hypothetical protein